MICKDKDGHLSLDCEQIEPEKSMFAKVSKIICIVAAVFLFVHLLLFGIDRHMALKETNGFSFTGGAIK